MKEFEEKRGDREVENVFKVLEKVTELRDCEVDKVCLSSKLMRIELCNRECAFLRL